MSRKIETEKHNIQGLMELHQARPFGTEERKPTHDFLSLYSNSTAQLDPRSPSQGSYLKTHDFLQPLETKGSAKEEATEETSWVVEKAPPPPSVKHILPGRIGTYSINQISYVNNNSNQRVPKPEAPLLVRQATSTDRNDDNSNCSSYTSSGFTLWEDSSGKAGKENNAGEKTSVEDKSNWSSALYRATECAAKPGQWTSAERTSQSYCNNRHGSFNARSSSQTTGQKNQSFIEMMKSARDSAHDEVQQNEEETFFLKKEPFNIQREVRVKVDGKSTDQKPNTPRSKHSATEQRRRSKINDRFQMLRELIPNSDQKRDKASFLLEVIEYIHFLQGKVHKYEGSFQGWSNEQGKLMPWQRNNDKPTESFQPRGTDNGSSPSPTMLFASKIDNKNISISPTILGSKQNVESGLSTTTTSKTVDHQAGIMNKAFPIPISSHLNFFTSTQIGGHGGVVSPFSHRPASDAENTKFQPPMECQNMAATNEKLRQKELTIEGGAISISSVYSKGLLHTLTHALQSSGVDLSQASISVQIELGKQANIRSTGPMSVCGAKDGVVPSNNEKMMRSRVASSGKSDQAVKKLKTCRS